MEYSENFIIKVLDAIGFDLSGLNQEEKGEVYANLDLILKDMNKRDVLVLYYLYEKDMTLRRAGEEIGLSTERVRQIQYRALRYLRSPARKTTLAEGSQYRKLRNSLEAEMGILQSEIEEKKKELLDLKSTAVLLEQYLDTLNVFVPEEVKEEKREAMEWLAKHGYTSLEEFGFSSRICTCCQRVHVYTVSDLLALDEIQLYRMRGIGKGSVEEILGLLHKNGFFFKWEMCGVVSPA